MKREPTVLITAIGALLASMVKAAQLLGIIELDGDQMAGITLVLDNFLLVAGALFIRDRVTPTGSPTLELGQSVNNGAATVTSVVTDPVVRTPAVAAPEDREP